MAPLPKETARQADDAAKPVFNMFAEAEAKAHGTTTLTPAQLEKYKELKDSFNTVPTPGTNGWRDDPEGRANYGKLLHDLTELRGKEDVPVIGKLLYEAAHAPSNGQGIMADVFAMSPEAKKMEFIGQHEKTPVSFETILKEGIDVGHGGNIEPNQEWLWKKIQADAQSIAAQHHTHHTGPKTR